MKRVDNLFWVLRTRVVEKRYVWPLWATLRWQTFGLQVDVPIDSIMTEINLKSQYDLWTENQFEASRSENH